MKPASPLFLFLLLFFGVLSCDNAATEKVVEAQKKELPQDFTVAGALNLDTNQKDTLAKNLSLASRPVALTDESGVTIAKAVTQPNGTFSLQVSTNGASLRLAGGGGARLPSGLKIQSLFADQEEKGDAMGVKSSVTLDPANLDGGDQGPTLNLGEFGVRKVGAIIGRLKLETGENPVGIEVYVPGTTYIAKADEQGRYLLGFLPKGTYTLRAERDGFSSLQWADIKVGSEETVHLPEATMEIAKGPHISDLTLKGLDAAAPQVSLKANVTLSARVTGANRIRMSQLSDFRDAAFRALEPGKFQYEIPFQLTGADGDKTIFFEAADSDGLSVVSQLQVLLDTEAPKVPEVDISSPRGLPGFASNTEPNLVARECGDVQRLAVVEGDRDPVEGDFALRCDQAMRDGVAITISAGEGEKSLNIWALDRAGQRSAEPRKVKVTLDQTDPVLAVQPPAGVYNAGIKIDAQGNESVRIYYTVDGSNPDQQATKLTTDLVLIGTTSLKLVLHPDT